MKKKDGQKPSGIASEVSVGALLAGAASIVLLAATALTAQDCNSNDSRDNDDIAAGISTDCNDNGVPDECEFQPLRYGSASDRLVIGARPWDTATVDLDGDGLKDIAATHNTSVTIFINAGAPAFRPGVEYDAEASVRFLQAVDVDGDGDLDLAANATNSVQVLENLGDGTLGHPVRVPVRGPTNSFVASDVNGDGHIDWVVGGFQARAGFLSISTSRGDGTFEPPVDLPADRRPGQFLAADYDGDGDVDVVLPGRHTDVLEFYENDATGGFQLASTVPMRWTVDTVRGGDLDGDGDLDLLLKSETAARLDLLEQRSTGVFDPPRLVRSRVRGGVTVIDLDSDGDLDVASAAHEAALVLQINLGNGEFRPNPLEAGDIAIGAQFADLDADGDMDIALSTNTEIRLLFGGAPGRLDLQTLRLGVGGINPHGIAVADFDGDSDADIVVPNGGNASVTFFPNDGNGRFQSGGRQTSTAVQRLDSLGAGDVDNDGDLDAISTSAPNNSIVLFRNNGRGVFGWTRHDAGAGATQADFGDVDGNGYLDLLSANRTGNSVTVWFQSDDGATFERRLDLHAGISPSAVTAVDLNGDGKTDIAASNGGSADFSVLLNNGDSTFQPARRYPASGGLRYLAAGDIDNDGDNDLVGTTGGSAAVLLNHGDGTFAPTTHYPLARQPYSHFLADVDADGALDVISANEESSTISLLVGDGAGAFSAPRLFPTGRGLRFAASGDLDGDGDLDLVSANRGSNDLTLLVNQLEESADPTPYLENICTPLDFERLSIAATPPVERALRFLSPAGPLPGGEESLPGGEETLPGGEETERLATLFQNTIEFRSHLDFLAGAFPERFPALDPMQFIELVGRRETRQYFAGTIERLRRPEGYLFGFDIEVDTKANEAGPTQLLTLEEVREVYASLRAVFSLETLVYRPGDRAAQEAAENWVEPGFPVHIDASPAPPDEEPPPPPGFPTFTLEVPPGFSICGTFATAAIDRGPLQELERKSVIVLRSGSIDLPTRESTFAADLFEEVRFGPQQELAQPASPGHFTVLSFPGEGQTTIHRFTYAQTFVLEDGRELEVEWVRPVQLRAEGERKLDERFVVTEAFFATEVGSEAIHASLDREPALRYGSCSYTTLPRFEIEVELDDGARLRLEERFQETVSLLATGPASLTRAEVRIGEELRVVDDYWSLVYSSARHNTAVRYWIVLEETLQIAAPAVAGIDVKGIELALADPPEMTLTASYLGADFAVVAQVDGTYRKSPLVTTRPSFLRGDANGDGSIAIVDAIALLGHLFRREPLPCRRAADSNDDGRLDVIDGVKLVGLLFGRTDALPPPFPACAQDTDEQGLSCESGDRCD